MAQAEMTTWRPTYATWLRGNVVLVLLFSGVVVRATGRLDSSGRPVDWWIDALFAVGLIVMVFATVVPLARTRVRLLAEGLEVRVMKSRLIPYAMIGDVRVDRGTDDKTIMVTLRDGERVTLPVPVLGRRRPSPADLDSAVASIRSRSDLGSAPPRLP